jgi:hypothetical protein
MDQKSKKSRTELFEERVDTLIKQGGFDDPQLSIISDWYQHHLIEWQGVEFKNDDAQKMGTKIIALVILMHSLPERGDFINLFKTIGAAAKHAKAAGASARKSLAVLSAIPESYRAEFNALLPGMELSIANWERRWERIAAALEAIAKLERRFQRRRHRPANQEFAIFADILLILFRQLGIQPTVGYDPATEKYTGRLIYLAENFLAAGASFAQAYYSIKPRRLAPASNAALGKALQREIKRFALLYGQNMQTPK